MRPGGGLAKYKCEECGNSYARKDGLKRHQRVSHDPGGAEEPKNYKCSLCPSAWPKQFLLNRHMRLVHEKKYKCILPDTLVAAGWPPCGAAFGKDTALWYHICRFHKHIRPKKFLRDMMAGASAENHDPATAPPEELPEDDGKAICPFENCDSQFAHQTVLLRHLQQHVRCPFACASCGERFALVKFLTAHYKDSRNACQKPQSPSRRLRKAEAEGLEAAANSSSVLQKRWPCDQCPLVFTQNRNLTEHVRTVHLKTVSYACEFCPYVTARRFAYKRHMASEMRSRQSDAEAVKGTPKKLWKSVPLVQEIDEEDRTCVERHVIEEAEPARLPKRRRQLFAAGYPTTADIDAGPVVLIEESQMTPSASEEELVVLIEPESPSDSTDFAQAAPVEEIAPDTSVADPESFVEQAPAEPEGAELEGGELEGTEQARGESPTVEVSAADPVSSEAMVSEIAPVAADEEMPAAVDEEATDTNIHTKPPGSLFTDSGTEQEEDDVAAGERQGVADATPARQSPTPASEAVPEDTDATPAESSSSITLATPASTEPPSALPTGESTPISSRPQSEAPSRLPSPALEQPLRNASERCDPPHSPITEAMERDTSATSWQQSPIPVFEESEAGEESPRFDYVPQTPRPSIAERSVQISSSDSATSSASSSAYSESRRESPVSASVSASSAKAENCAAAEASETLREARSDVDEMTAPASAAADSAAQQIEEPAVLMREESDSEAMRDHEEELISPARTESESRQTTESCSDRALFSDLLASVERIHNEQTQAELARLGAGAAAVDAPAAVGAKGAAEETTGSGSVDSVEVGAAADAGVAGAQEEEARARASLIAELFNSD